MRIFLTIAMITLAMAGRAEDPTVLRFVALGDAPYGQAEAQRQDYRALLANISAAKPPLVVHVGDIIGGRARCDDGLIRAQHADLNAVRAPVLYTPGDNEWTDCHRRRQGGFDTNARLAFLRGLFFEAGRTQGRTLGRPKLTLAAQKSAGFPENARISIAGVGFVTLHVVGSHDNARRDRREHLARRAANLAWLEQSFADFAGRQAIVVALHADMFRIWDFKPNRKRWRRASVYRAVGDRLGALSNAYGKPVLLVFGDSHTHRAFWPNRKTWPNLYAIEVHGDKDIKAIEIAVRPGAKTPFKVMRVLDP